MDRNLDLLRIVRVERVLVEREQRPTTELRIAIGWASRGKPL